MTRPSSIDDEKSAGYLVHTEFGPDLGIHIPLLREWAAVDYKKVRQRIGQVIRRRSGDPDLPGENADGDPAESTTLKVVP